MRFNPKSYKKSNIQLQQGISGFLLEDEENLKNPMHAQLHIGGGKVLYPCMGIGSSRK